MKRAAIVLTALVVSTLVVTPTPAITQEELHDQLQRSACAAPTKLLVRTWRGHRADRGADLELLPKEPDFVGHGGLPHSGPWDYVADVPLLLYGPGYIEPQGAVDRVVTLADIAPTQGELIGFPFDAPDGTTLTEALVPEGERTAEHPKLFVVVVWDGAGRAVLDASPNAWPELRAMIDRGTWYENAEVGSSPPSTAQIHATIGTGAFSHNHGLTAHKLRIGDRLTIPWEAGSRYLTAATFADLYDRAEGNRPIVGTLATVAIQMGMMGHGSLWGGGDRDIAVLREWEGAATQGAEGLTWNLTSNVAPYYRLPTYVNDLPPVTEYFEETDRQDGRDDGRWHELELDGAVIEDALLTPARIPFQTRLIEEVITREGFGADEVPDLLYINYKLIDEIGHIFSMNSVEMSDSIEAQDAEIPVLIDLLNEHVGEGEWVMALTADHGHTPDPAVSGASVISPTAVTGVIQARFDTDGDDTRIAEFTQPTNVFIDHDEMEQNGTTLEEIAAYMLTVTKGEVQGGEYPVAPEVADEPAFLTVYPSSMIDDLPCLRGRIPDHGSKDAV